MGGADAAQEDRERSYSSIPFRFDEIAYYSIAILLCLMSTTMEPEPSFYRSMFQEWSQEEQNNPYLNQNDAAVQNSSWTNNPFSTTSSTVLRSSGELYDPLQCLMSLPLEDFNEGLESQQPNADSPPSAAHVSTAPAPNRCPHRGFWATVEYKGISTGLIEDVIVWFQEFCCSTEFISKWVAAGFANPVFCMNPHLEEGNPCFDRFQAGLQTLRHDSTMGCAFHGTSLHNIPLILKMVWIPSCGEIESEVRESTLPQTQDAR